MNKDTEADLTGKSITNAFNLNCENLEVQQDALIDGDLVVGGTVTLNTVSVDTATVRHLLVNVNETINGPLTVVDNEIDLTASNNTLSLKMNPFNDPTNPSKGLIRTSIDAFGLDLETDGYGAGAKKIRLITDHVEVEEGDLTVNNNSIFLTGDNDTFEIKMDTSTGVGTLTTSTNSDGIYLVTDGYGVNDSKAIRLFTDTLFVNADSFFEQDINASTALYFPESTDKKVALGIGSNNSAFFFMEDNSAEFSVTTGAGDVDFESGAGNFSVSTTGVGDISLDCVGGGSINQSVDGVGEISSTIKGLGKLNLSCTGGGVINITNTTGEIAMTNDSGPINITTVTGLMSFTIDEGDMTLKTLNGLMTLNNLLGDTAIKVEEGQLSLSNTLGDINITATAGIMKLNVIEGTMTIQNDNGLTNITNLSGDMNIKTDIGIITMTTLEGAMNFSVAGGEMTFLNDEGLISFGTGGGAFSVTTGDGAVEFFLEAGIFSVGTASGAVLVETLSGDITFNIQEFGAMLFTNTEGDITLKAIAGQIILDASAQIKLTSAADITANVTTGIMSFNTTSGSTTFQTETGTITLKVLDIGKVAIDAGIGQINISATEGNISMYTNVGGMILATGAIPSIIEETIQISSSGAILMTAATDITESVTTGLMKFNTTSGNMNFTTETGEIKFQVLDLGKLTFDVGLGDLNFLSTEGNIKIATSSGGIVLATGATVPTFIVGAIQAQSDTEIRMTAGGAMTFTTTTGLIKLTNNAGGITLDLQETGEMNFNTFSGAMNFSISDVGAMTFSTTSGLIKMTNKAGGISLLITEGGEMNLSTTSGAMNFGITDVGQMTFSTTSGLIKLTNKAGGISLNITEGGEINLNTVTGAINLAISDAGAMNLTTTSGLIKLSNGLGGITMQMTDAGELNFITLAGITKFHTEGGEIQFKFDTAGDFNVVMGTGQAKFSWETVGAFGVSFNAGGSYSVSSLEALSYAVKTTTGAISYSVTNTSTGAINYSVATSGAINFSVAAGGAANWNFDAALAGAFTVNMSGGTFDVDMGGGAITFNTAGGDYSIDMAAGTFNCNFLAAGAVLFDWATYLGAFTVNMTGGAVLYNMGGGDYSINMGAGTFNCNFLTYGAVVFDWALNVGDWSCVMAGGSFNVTLGGGACLFNTAGGLFEVTTAAGAITLITGLGAIELTSGVQIDIKAGENVNIESLSGALNFAAQDGGANFGYNDQFLGHFAVTTHCTSGAFSTGNIDFFTHKYLAYTGPGNITFDTTDAVTGDFTINAHGHIEIHSFSSTYGVQLDTEYVAGATYLWRFPQDAGITGQVLVSGGSALALSWTSSPSFEAPLTITATDGTRIPLQITSGMGLSNSFLLSLIPLLSVGGYNDFVFGQDNSLNNAADIRFTFEGPGSTSNYLGFGFFGNPNLLTFDGNANLRLFGFFRGYGYAEVNNLIQDLQVKTASATPFSLSQYSVHYQYIQGSAGTSQTILLLDETDYEAGLSYSIINQNNADTFVQDSSGTALITIPSGGHVQFISTSVASSTGNWISFARIPQGVQWGYTSLLLNNNMNIGFTGGGTNYVYINQPNPVSTSYNFNLPTTGGIPGQFLTSQGGGTNSMTWTSATLTMTVPAFLNILPSTVTLPGTINIGLATGVALPITSGGTGATFATGSGGVVLQTSPTISGQLSLSSTSNALLIQSTQSAGAFFTTYCNNLYPGNSINMNFGQSNSNYDQTFIQFNYVSPGSTSNSLGFGFQGATNLLTLNAAGQMNLKGALGISADATNYVNIKAPVGASWNFNLPATAGTAGQVLTSQGGGTGTMTWTTISGSGGIFTNPSLTGNVTITTSGGIPLAITNTDTAGTFITAFYSSMTSSMQMNFGQSNSTNNTGIMQFNYMSTGSSSNSIGLGFYGANNILQITAAGKVSINSNLAPSFSIGSTSASTTATSIMLQNSATQNLLFGVAGHTGDFSTDAAAGDTIIRTGTNLFLQNGAGGCAVKIDSSNTVTVKNSLYVIGATSISSSPTGTGWWMGTDSNGFQLLQMNAASNKGIFLDFSSSGVDYNARLYYDITLDSFYTQSNHIYLLGRNSTTTDTNTVLKIRGTAGISNDGTNYITITSPSGASWNFNLPSTAGTAGQVLTSQGGGSNVMTWTTVSGGGGSLTNPAMTGNASITTTGGTPLAITNTDTSGTFITAFYSSMTSSMQMNFGQSNSTNNTGIMQFNYSSSGSTSNSIGLGFYGGNNLFTIDASGKATINSSTTGVFTVTSSNNASQMNMMYLLTPNLPAYGSAVSYLGTSTATNNSGYLSFSYTGSGSSSNSFLFGLTGNSATLKLNTSLSNIISNFEIDGISTGTALTVKSGGSATANNIIEAYCAGLPANSYANIYFGQSLSSYNAGFFTLAYVGSGNSSNAINIGLQGPGIIFQLNPSSSTLNSNLSISTTVTGPLINTTSTATGNEICFQAMYPSSLTNTTKQILIGYSTSGFYVNGYLKYTYLASSSSNISMGITGSSNNIVVSQASGVVVNGPFTASSGAVSLGTTSTGALTSSSINCTGSLSAGSFSVTQYNGKSIQILDTGKAYNSYIGTSNSLIGTGIGALNMGLNANVSSTSPTWINFYNSSNASCGDISPSASGGVNYNSTSDYRVKTNIEQMDPVMKTVKKLPVKKYNMFDSKIKSCGFIAHELNEFLPSLVKGKKDELDEKGNMKLQSVNLMGLIPYLVKAIQEQQELIEQLQQKFIPVLA